MIQIKNALDKRLKECQIKREEIINSINKVTDKQIIFIYTSHMEGLGTNNSDFDIYVLSNLIPNNSFRKSETGSLVDNCVLNGIQLDIEYWKIDDVKNLIQLLDSKQNLKFNELKFLHKLKFSEVVNEDEIGIKIINDIDEVKISSIVYNQYSTNARSSLDDGIYLYNSKEYICALSCIRASVQSAIAALNTKKGYTCLKQKWTSKIFIDKEYDRELIDDYLNLQVYANISSDSIKCYIESLIELTQKILAKLVLG